jgi:hypothetical protein
MLRRGGWDDWDWRARSFANADWCSSISVARLLSSSRLITCCVRMERYLVCVIQHSQHGSRFAASDSNAPMICSLLGQRVSTWEATGGTRAKGGSAYLARAKYIVCDALLNRCASGRGTRPFAPSTTFGSTAGIRWPLGHSKALMAALSCTSVKYFFLLINM